MDQFRIGAKTGPAVLGQDLSLGQTLGFDVIEDRNIFANRDVITHSLADGAIADWSLIGAVSPCTLASCADCMQHLFSRLGRLVVMPITMDYRTSHKAV